MLTALFGGITLDLRNAVFEGDAVIKVNVAFGGVDILLPGNVKVESKVAPIFGGFSEKRISTPQSDAPTLFITGLVLFGGVDAK